MGVSALTDAQRSAVDALVAANRIEPVPVDRTRARGFLDAARDRISQLPLLTSAGVKYDVAYDAAHDVGEALLAAHGYRTRNGAGQHEALGRFLRAVLDTPPGDVAAARFVRHANCSPPLGHAGWSPSGLDGILSDRALRQTDTC